MLNDEGLRERIAWGRTQTKVLIDRIQEILRTFESVKTITADLLERGLTGLDEETQEAFLSFEDRAAALLMDSMRFDAVLNTTYDKPVAPTPLRQIDPESEQALLIRELNRAAAAVTAAMDEIVRNTTGERQQYYVGEVGRAASILLSLVSPLLLDEGEAN